MRSLCSVILINQKSRLSWPPWKKENSVLVNGSSNRVKKEMNSMLLNLENLIASSSTRMSPSQSTWRLIIQENTLESLLFFTTLQELPLSERKPNAKPGHLIDKHSTTSLEMPVWKREKNMRNSWKTGAFWRPSLIHTKNTKLLMFSSLASPEKPIKFFQLVLRRELFSLWNREKLSDWMLRVTKSSNMERVITSVKFLFSSRTEFSHLTSFAALITRSYWKSIKTVTLPLSKLLKTSWLKTPKSITELKHFVDLPLRFIILFSF